MLNILLFLQKMNYIFVMAVIYYVNEFAEKIQLGDNIPITLVFDNGEEKRVTYVNRAMNHQVSTKFSKK